MDDIVEGAEPNDYYVVIGKLYFERQTLLVELLQTRKERDGLKLQRDTLIAEKEGADVNDNP